MFSKPTFTKKLTSNHLNHIYIFLITKHIHIIISERTSQLSLKRRSLHMGCGSLYGLRGVARLGPVVAVWAGRGHDIGNLNRRVSQYQETDTVNGTVNDTVTRLRESLQKVYAAILRNPQITHAEIMETLHISESTANRATRDLKKLGYIDKEGSDKTGQWVYLKRGDAWSGIPSL